MSGTHTGSCRCGLIGMEAGAEPFRLSYCHCRDCRKQTGAPVTAFVGFREPEISWQGGKPASWSVGRVERIFCRSCGSQIAYRDEGLPGEVYFYLGFMDEPGAYPPRLHAFEERRLPFLRIDDALPRHHGFSIER